MIPFSFPFILNLHPSASIGTVLSKPATMVGSRRHSDADVTEPATTAAATNTKREITEEMPMDSDLMLKAGKILTKNAWIDAEDLEVLALICAEAKEALRKEQQRKREASHYAQQLISAKDDRSTQRLEKEKAVLQAAYDQLLRRLNARQKQHAKLEQPKDSDAKLVPVDQSDHDKETKTLALKDADGVADSPTLLGTPLDAFHSAMTFLDFEDIWTTSCCSKSSRMRGYDEGLWRLIAKRDYPHLIELVERIKDGTGGGVGGGEAMNMDTWSAVYGRNRIGEYVPVRFPPPSSSLRLMYRRERVLDVSRTYSSPELYPEAPKALPSYYIHLKFHLMRDLRSVGVVSKFVDQMEFGKRRDESGGDAIRFTLDVYPQLREYEYDSIEVSCDLVQRSTSKRCVLIAVKEIESRRYDDGPGEYLVSSSEHQRIQGGIVRACLHFKTNQDDCPCSCGGWVCDPDDEEDAFLFQIQKFCQKFCLIQPHCACDWASEEWKAFRLLEFELFFEGEWPDHSDVQTNISAQEQLGKMNEFEFI